MKDKRLEALSDKVRMGIPIDFIEAIEVVNYQERLRVEKRNRPTLWKQFKAWVRNQTGDGHAG